MNRRAYIETTIPSFYHEVRTEPEMVARREWTREWWDHHRADFDLVTSEAVIEELESGTFPQKSDALTLIQNLPLLDIEEAARTSLMPILGTRSCRLILRVMRSISPSHHFINAISC